MRQLDEAERAAERAVALDPNASDAHAGLGNIRDFQGRHEDAAARHRRAQSRQDALCEAILKIENVLNRTLELVGPDVCLGSLNELPRNTQPS
jgi:hypothetical protein